MKKIFFYCMVFLVPLSLYAKPKSNCGFSGIFNNQKINKKNSFCSVERTGEKRYFLMRANLKEKWLFDFSNIEDQGQTNLSIKAIGPGGFRGPKARTYRDSSNQKILTYKKDSKIRYTRVNTVLIDKNKKTKKIKGILMWGKAQPQTSYTGSLKYKSDHVTISINDKVKMKPWHTNGFRLSKLFLIKKGETATLTIQIPTNKSGTYTNKNQRTKLQLSHIILKNNKMTMYLYQKGVFAVKVLKSGNRLTVSFKGNLVTSKGDKTQIQGEFAGRID